jgi:nucleoside-diphosphate-sugar epimerase
VSFANSVDVVTVSDFNDPVDWGPILHGMDIVCHVAGYAHADYPDDAHANRVNVTTTWELAHAAARAQVLNAFCSFHWFALKSAPQPRI